MADFGREKGDDALLLALAAGDTVRAAAKKARMAERTAHRRMADPDFRRRLQDVRADMAQRALGKLSDGAATFADVLRELATKAESEAVRLSAARAGLELGNRLRETVELTAQVQELRREVEEGRHGNRNAEPGGRAATETTPRPGTTGNDKRRCLIGCA